MCFIKGIRCHKNIRSQAIIERTNSNIDEDDYAKYVRNECRG